MNGIFITLYIILTIASVVTLIKNKYKWSLLFFLIFATKGMSFLPEEVGFIKASYITFLYCILFFLKNKSFILVRFYKGIGIPLKRLLVFFSVSVFFSIAYYQLSPIQTIVVGSRYLILAAVLFFEILSFNDKLWLLRTIFYLTLVLSILYVIQSFTGIEILQMANDDGGFDAQGFYHGAILPPFAQILIFVSLFDRQFLNKRLRIVGAGIFLLAVICTMYRTLLMTTFLTILIIMLFNKSFKRNMIIVAIVGFLLITFQEQFSTRANKDGKTKEDIELLLEGTFEAADYQSQNGLTMLYRFALLKERLDYVVDKPLEAIFGLGLTVDNKWAYNQYHFRYGIISENGQPSQLRSPDIDWVNFLCNYGILGTFLFFAFYFKIIKTLKYYKQYSQLANILFFYCLLIMITTFSGNVLSEPYSLIPFFLIYSIAVDKKALVLNK